MTVRSRPDGKWTYDDYAAIPPDLLRHEIIDGEHCVNPAPSLYHQEILGRLYLQLYALICETGRGIVHLAPLDVQLSDHDVVQPDLVVVLENNRAILTPAKILGPPDLVIEILSPSTRRNDRTLKRDRYAKFGVPTYWIVDPHTHTVEQHRLEEATYRLVATESEAVSWILQPEVTVDLTRVW